MALPPKQDQTVSLSEATKLTTSFRKNAAQTAVKAHLFWNDGLQKILAQKDCVAVRFYYAQMDDGKPTLVAVGVDEKGEDITQGTILERAGACPPFCGDGSPLKG